MGMMNQVDILSRTRYDSAILPRRLSLASELLSFASPKQSNQSKSDPDCLAGNVFPVPCGARFVRALAELATLKQTPALDPAQPALLGAVRRGEGQGRCGGKQLRLLPLPLSFRVVSRNLVALSRRLLGEMLDQVCGDNGLLGPGHSVSLAQSRRSSPESESLFAEKGNRHPLIPIRYSSATLPRRFSLVSKLLSFVSPKQSNQGKGAPDCLAGNVFPVPCIARFVQALAELASLRQTPVLDPAKPALLGVARRGEGQGLCRRLLDEISDQVCGDALLLSFQTLTINAFVPVLSRDGSVWRLA
ncbi:hypothetical protein SAMN05192560_1367 [Methylobacillus rhizosphaerae]|uniref:Uncharacterized protein n=1 Tax=Methylobacillus rhizosphaerae TaxID=551994 RepID=A0A238ZMX0_9PROT|nr:hypothetical protein SAMN05192560_1367 [Methylobacillus rhizosphaerae]